MFDTKKAAAITKIIVLFPEDTEAYTKSLLDSMIENLNILPSYDVVVYEDTQSVADAIKNGHHDIFIAPERDGDNNVDIYSVHTWIREHKLERFILLMNKSEKKTLKLIEMLADALYDGFFLGEDKTSDSIALRYLIDRGRTNEEAERYYKEKIERKPKVRTKSTARYALIALDMKKNDMRVMEITSMIINRLAGEEQYITNFVNTKKALQRAIAAKSYDLIICSTELKGEFITIPTMRAYLLAHKAKILIPVVKRFTLPGGKDIGAELIEKGLYNGILEYDLTESAVYKLITSGRTKSEAERYYGIRRDKEPAPSFTAEARKGAGGSGPVRTLIEKLFYPLLTKPDIDS